MTAIDPDDRSLHAIVASSTAFTIRRTLVVLVAIVAAACQRGGPASPPAANSPDQSADRAAVDPTGTSDAPAAVQQARVGTKAAAGADQANGSAEPAPAAQPTGAEDVAESRAEQAKRLMILAPGGPVLVECRLRIDGRPLDEAFEALAAEVLRVADRDQNGLASWQEIVDSPDFRYGQYGNQPIRNPAEARQVIRAYDTDGDGEVDARELPRFLTRNASGSQPLVFESADSDRDFGRRRSALWQLLDYDGDGALSIPERDQAAAILRKCDVDDDEILWPEDLRELPEDDAGEKRIDRTGALPQAAFSLESITSWRSLLYALEEFYSLGGPLRIENLPAAAAWFPALDVDGDGRFTAEEISGLLTIEPGLRIEAGFADPGGAGRSPPPLEIRVERTGSLAGVETVRHSAVHASVLLAGAILECFVTDLLAQDDPAQIAESRVEQLDQNRDGYLDRSESQGSPDVLENWDAADTNQDGRLDPNELADSLRRRQAMLRCQLRARVDFPPDSLFLHLDSDRDGRLAPDEWRELPSQSAEWDRDGDGLLEPEDLPAVLQLAIARGEPTQKAEMFRSPPTPMSEEAVSPTRWYQSMDRNGDGTIDRREFPGTVEQFQRLDDDRDGTVSVSEALVPEVK